MTLQKTAHYVESFKICCQVEDSMLSRTTTAADGETRRTAYPRVVYNIQYYLTYTQTTSHFTMEPGTFVYADDLCVTDQYPYFTEVEHTIEEALDELTTYYRSNSLRANPDKTQITSFHLKNREAKNALEVKRNNRDLENTLHPKYLGVTLDRTLSYKKHIHNTKMKVATRNNLLKKLSNSKWGCNARTIRTTALALSYSAAENACPVWARFSHASKLDPELNDA